MTSTEDVAPAGTASSPGGPARRADGVQLIGEMAGSGYREPPALARRGDGQTVQLTPILYLLLEAIDGRRDHEELAARLSDALGRHVTADNVRTLVDTKLQHTGLLVDPDGSQPVAPKSNPLLALKFKYAITDPEKTNRVTGPFARLFHPVLVVAILTGFLTICWWLFFVKGLASAAHEAFDKPALLVLVFLVTVLSAGFHEFGHAAAARRGGSTPGVMGAGIYLVWPAFYTDVTDSYRLGRGGRLRTDLGGLYFNAIVAIAIVGIWWATGYDALLLVVATQVIQMMRQLTPLVRFDGYHVLADLTGVPDLFHRIKPTLLGLLPWKWGSPESRVLKPWARAVVTLWVAVVVPVLAFMLFTIVVALPRILGTAWAGLAEQQSMLAQAFGDADVIGVAAHVLAMMAVAFPILAIALILGRLVRSGARSVWKRTDGKPIRRSGSALLATVLVAGLIAVWWPQDGTYRPIQAYERGTLTDAAQAVPLTGSAPKSLVEGSQGRLVTAWADGDARPTSERPQLAMLLVPRDSSEDVSKAESWVFPFDKPLEPGEGDNQALAVNTTDGTIQYDVAFALVWVEDDSPALQRNESYAFASCTGCAAVSVGFQVVLVTGDNHIAAPQNIAAAVNVDCVNCLTYALATQLFVTLDGPLTDAAMAELDALWSDIATFGANIVDVPQSEIRDRLTSYEEQILQIIEKDQGSRGRSDPAATPTPADPSPSGGPTAGSPSEGAGEPTAAPDSGTEPGTATPSPARTPMPTPTPTPTP